jgi:hypothetical protein
MRLALHALIVVTASALVGCGGGNDVDQYLGTWRYDTIKTATVTCATTPPQTFAAMPSEKLFRPGVSSPLVDISVFPIDYATRCDFGFSVNGTTATLQPGQACALATSSAMIAPTAWRFTMLGPNLAEEEGGANITGLTFNDPTSGTAVQADCVYTLQAIKLTRVSGD